MHACGVVHRDLKPGNVLLAADGPHVIDFGISRAFEGASVTSTGMVVGTPGYMSPEQAEGQRAGPPSDVFSLGCVLAYAATGNAPFGGGSAASILYRVVTGEPDLSGVPASLRQVITPCLAKNSAERIGLAQLGPMIAALGPAISGTLGGFWPEPLASIITADNTHPVTQISESPLSRPPSGQLPVNRVPGVAQPSPLPQTATPGLTGHAPMVADGYYAAAAYGMDAANPAANSPAAPAPAAVQWQYAQPQYAQPSVEQPWTPQYPAGHQPVPWPQQAPQAPGPTTPWPQQQGSGGAWPGSGHPSGPGGPSRPSGPGFPSAAPPLAQYAPGSGPRWRPTRAEIPPPVLGAIRLMYVGAMVTLADLIFGTVAAANENAYWVKHRYALNSAVRVAAKHNQTVAGALDATTLLGGALGIVCWLVIARACRRGRSWTRTAGTVLLALNTASLLTVLLATHNDPTVKTASLIVWIIGLAAAVPLWGRQAGDFFLAWRRDNR